MRADASAIDLTVAVQVGVFFSCADTQAMPRPTLAGSGVPQPDRSATMRSTLASRGAPPSRSRRYFTGSTLARLASSSIMISTAKKV